MYRPSRTALVIGVVTLSAALLVVGSMPGPSEPSRTAPPVEDRILADKAAYRPLAVEAGDAAVFRYPKDEARNFIKRLPSGFGK